jgi:hypothetical protein
MVLPPPILGHNLQFSGKFAERPFFLFLFFLGIFKNLAASLKISLGRQN